MQLYAFDRDNQLIQTWQARRQIDYFCLECEQIVRLRGGPQRQAHFYHYEPNIFCRQHQKGPIHLHLQSYFLKELPVGDCRLEYSFPSIRRIADVVWISQKIVFEIQYSPITKEEVIARNRDYQKIGWRVVWILHEKKYNQDRLTAAEIALENSSHYFSNMDQTGQGFVYDQFALKKNDLRICRLSPLQVHFNVGIHDCSSSRSFVYPLQVLHNRNVHWKLSFVGDLMHHFFDTPTSAYMQDAIAKEKSILDFQRSFVWTQLPRLVWQRGILGPYCNFFRFFLEKMCR